MLAQPSTTDRAELLAKLGELQLLLDAPNAPPPPIRECWRRAAEARNQCELLGLPGLGKLLRHLVSGFAHRAASGTALEADELTTISVWYGMARSAVAFGADARECELLVMLLAEIPWLPALTQAQSSAIVPAIVAELAVAGSANAADADSDATPALALASDALDDHGARSLEHVTGPSTQADDAAMERDDFADRGAFDQMPGWALVAESQADPLPQFKHSDALHDGLLATVFIEADPASEPIQIALADRVMEADTLSAAETTAGTHADPGPGIDQDVALGLDRAAGEEAPPDPIDQATTCDDDGLLAETADASAAAPIDIWIAHEELQLTRTAISDQILPGSLAWASAQSEHESRQIRDDLGYHISLIANAMELLGTPSLGELLHGMERAIESGAMDAAQLIGANAAILAFLEAPEPDTAAFVVSVSADIPDVREEWALRFLDEAGRIRLGVDPAQIAARKRYVEPGDTDLRHADDVLPNVLASMLAELPGNAQRLGAAVRELVATGSAAPIDEARRVAHTLKGDANTVGILGLANLTHALEDLLIELLKVPERLGPGMAAFLAEAADAVEECADHVLGRGPAPLGLDHIYQRALDWANALLEATADPEHAPQRPVDAPAAQAHAPVAAALVPEQGGDEDTGAASLMVQTVLLDELQRMTGEMLVTSRQVAQRLQQLAAAQRELSNDVGVERNLANQLDDLVALRGAALKSASMDSASEVDALELDQYNELHVVSRRIMETNLDNNEHTRRMESMLSELDELMVEQERINDDLQRVVGKTRTTPFRDIVPRLQRVVRQTARQLGRHAELMIEGEATALDAALLEKLVEPLSHALRNAVDHGLEDAPLRIAAGKPAHGTIRVGVSISGDSALVEISDDGCGLDPDRIRAKAEQLGLVSAQDTLAPAELWRLILVPGFSTRDHVTQISGRGVGMDVVNQRIAALRGSLGIRSEPGVGMTVSIRLPLSQTSANVIVARGYDLVVAITAASVERIQSLVANDIASDDDGRLFADFEGERLPAVTLEALFDRSGHHSLPDHGSCLGLLVVGSDGKRHVVCARLVSEVARVVVKPISTLLPAIPAVRGMTQLGDGQLAPVIDIAQLVESHGRRLQPTGPAAWASVARLPTVVVADDSLSVRRALEQLMQDAGYEVASARDGLEALKHINERSPVAVLLDLEMPRMNGLDVCRYMRRQSHMRHTPVIMITSRASDKYRTMAAEAGVTELLGKPFAEDELAALVRTLVAQSQPVAVKEIGDDT